MRITHERAGKVAPCGPIAGLATMSMVHDAITHTHAHTKAHKKHALPHKHTHTQAHTHRLSVRGGCARVCMRAVGCVCALDGLMDL